MRAPHCASCAFWKRRTSDRGTCWNSPNGLMDPLVREDGVCEDWQQGVIHGDGRIDYLVAAAWTLVAAIGLTVAVLIWHSLGALLALIGD